MTPPTSATIADRVRDCMQVILKLSEEATAAIDLQTTPVVLPQWTSLTHLQLILELERRFEVMFDVEDIAALASVGALVATIERLKSA